MSESKSMVTAVVKSTPYIARLAVSLMWLYFTLSYRVRKTRGAFEKQLVAQGMSKENAKHLSASYEDFKNDITCALKQAVISRGR
jgi:hypothetical protein